MSRTERFVTRIDPTQFPTIVVAGCGAVGSVVARTLATMGVKNFHFIDYDHVEEHNLGTQFYPSTSVGSYKVDALSSECHRVGDISTMQVSTGRLQDADLPQEPFYMFMCVDSMRPRWWFRNNWGQALAVIDTRMAGMFGEVYLRSTPESYEDILFPESEMFDQAACAVRSYPLTAMILAARAIELLIQHRLYGVEGSVPVNMTYGSESAAQLLAKRS